ncbi:MAG: alpha/beta fold hydrolase [Aggregatilineales bacterium]
MSALTVDGDLIHYEVLGRGRPVILIHDVIGSWRYWVPAMQHLHVKFRVYALDLYGYGDSAKTAVRYTLDQQIALLDAFMLQLGLPKAALIGHGLGALVAAEFTRLYPERVPRLMVVSAPLFNPGGLAQRQPDRARAMASPRRLHAAPTLPARPTPIQPPLAAPTLSNRPNDAANAPTIPNASLAMRKALEEAARARRMAAGMAAPPPPSTPAALEPMPAPLEANRASALPGAGDSANPLLETLTQESLEALLGRCFRRSEPEFEKLLVDIARADPHAAIGLASAFDPGLMLDTFQLLPVPVCLMHGSDDPILAAPDEAVLDYITRTADQLRLPILLPGVRHYPMLEDDRFARVATDFLEAPDISRIELKERWRRRTR